MFHVLFYSEKNCLPNHLICHLENNKDLEIKYLNDLLLLYLAHMTRNQSGAEKDNRLLFREQ